MADKQEKGLWRSIIDIALPVLLTAAFAGSAPFWWKSCSKPHSEKQNATKSKDAGSVGLDSKWKAEYKPPSVTLHGPVGSRHREPADILEFDVSGLHGKLIGCGPETDGATCEFHLWQENGEDLVVDPRTTLADIHYALHLDDDALVVSSKEHPADLKLRFYGHSPVTWPVHLYLIWGPKEGPEKYNLRQVYLLELKPAWS